MNASDNYWPSSTIVNVRAVGVRIALFLSLFALLFSVNVHTARAQLPTNEPEVIPLPQPESPYGKGYRNGLGVELFINNFGFGIGGQYRRLVGPMTNLTLSLDITGVRDVSEQTFQTYFGQQIVPNKYSRVLVFPMTIGVKKRFFARQISDNFRFYGSLSGGGALAFIYPYFKDTNNNGYRDNTIQLYEPVNDFFQGWKNGETQWGLTGQAMLGVDFGSNFSKLSAVEFGFNFYYFGKGIQMMEPNKPVVNNDGSPRYNPDGSIVMQHFHDKQKYFGTPQITFIFGGLW